MGFQSRTKEGKGIQDLHAIGEKGSVFRNGAVTLELKGLSLAGDRRCALIGYDSGDSSFAMTLKPMPQATIAVHGGSHYTGDLYVDLVTQWVLKATLAEIVVSETSGAILPQKLNSVIERRLLLRAVGKPEFEASRSAPAGAR